MKKRSDERVNFVSNSILIHKGEKFPCLLNNISTSGALIEMEGPVPDTIQGEDTCILNVLLLSPVKYNCKVVHLDSVHVGLQFISQIANGD
jgi:hypothetical protein